MTSIASQGKEFLLGIKKIQEQKLTSYSQLMHHPIETLYDYYICVYLVAVSVFAN